MSIQDPNAEKDTTPKAKKYRLPGHKGTVMLLDYARHQLAIAEAAVARYRRGVSAGLPGAAAALAYWEHVSSWWVGEVSRLQRRMVTMRQDRP